CASFLLIRRPPIFTLFPYTTLFRSHGFSGLWAGRRPAPPAQKKPRGQELSVGDKFLNHLIASVRIVVEHVIAGVKRCRIVKDVRSEEHTSELQSLTNIVCRLLLEKK